MLVTIAFLAGTAAGSAAAGIYLKITTSFTKSSQPGTLEEQAKRLREEHEKIRSRHQHFVKEILPRIPISHEKVKDFQGTGRTSVLLESILLDIEEIDGKISCGGVYLVECEQDIKDVLEALADLNANTLKTSTTAKFVFKELLGNPETAKKLFEGNFKEEAESREPNAGSLPGTQALNTSIPGPTPPESSPDV